MRVSNPCVEFKLCMHLPKTAMRVRYGLELALKTFGTRFFGYNLKDVPYLKPVEFQFSSIKYFVIEIIDEAGVSLLSFFFPLT